MRKDFRALIKPKNTAFVSLDYNGAEVRTFLDLSGIEQQSAMFISGTLKTFSITALIVSAPKLIFLVGFTTQNLTLFVPICIKKRKVLDKWYDGWYISTPFKRKIKVPAKKSLKLLDPKHN